MSEETASAPAEAPTTTASEGEGIAPEAVSAAPEGDGATTASDAVETIELGGVAVPVSALADLPDEVLRGMTRTVKVNGEEREVSIADALQAVSKAEGADAKMREAAKQRKQAEQALASIIADPLGSIEQIATMRGVSREKAREAVEKALLDRFEYESLDPQKRAELDQRREMERKARAFEEHQKRQAAERERAAHQQTVQTMQEQMTTALDRAGIANDPHAFSRAATIMSGLVSAEGDVPAAQLAAAMDKAVAQAKAEIAATRAGLFQADSDEALLERIPVDVQRKIARAYAAKVKKASASPTRPRGAPKTAQEPERKMTTQEWREWLAERDAAAS